jgi:hypothetical protein
MSTLVGVGIFVGLTVGIWLSYRLFMRGDTYEEKVAALLPPDFKPDVFHRKGDTYVGYEKARDRLVLVDWPHARVLSPKEVVSIAPVHESTLGVTHHWVAVGVPGATFSPFRIWFQFRSEKRDAWLRQLGEICKK